MPGPEFLQHFVESALYSLLGLGVFGLTFWVMTRVAPFSMRKEIEEDQNTALGIIVGSVLIGIALIISAAIGS